MTFNHFVKRYSKLVMIFIVLMIAIPMMIAGNLGGAPSDPEADETAGILGGKINVTKYEYRQQKFQAMASLIWMQIQADPDLSGNAPRAP